MVFNRTLLFAALSLTACGLDVQPRSGTYNAKSDCPDATVKETTLNLDFPGNIITIATDDNATKLGFPSAVFGYSIGSDVSNESGARSCTAQPLAKNTPYLVFLCKDNGTPVCTITLRQ